MQKEGQIVRASALYGAYSEQLKRAGVDVSPKRFYRVLEKHGFKRRADARGLYFDNLSFIKGV